MIVSIPNHYFFIFLLQFELMILLKVIPPHLVVTILESLLLILTHLPWIMWIK